MVELSFYTQTLLPVLLCALSVSIIFTITLIVILKPLLIRYALARPNARSSHKVPTPQGGGIAILLSSIIAIIIFSFSGYPVSKTLLVILWSLPLALLGGMDDIWPLSPLIRLIIQLVICAGLVVFSSMDSGRIFPEYIPFWFEQILLITAAVWFVNLFNFMDGLDWMCVSESVPVLSALCFFFITGGLLPETLLSASLLGGFLGFAWFNKPVARLFLGDAGSLPLGLLIGYLLLELAYAGALISALILPLYYVCDTTITLVRRFMQKKKVWQAHREHFYQQATDNGYSVLRVDTIVFILNGILALLAILAFFYSSALSQFICFCLGLSCVLAVLKLFATSEKPDGKPQEG